jgi:hypothetical protein
MVERRSPHANSFVIGPAVIKHTQIKDSEQNKIKKNK